jgi:hypothetical protein
MALTPANAIHDKSFAALEKVQTSFSGMGDLGDAYYRQSEILVRYHAIARDAKKAGTDNLFKTNAQQIAQTMLDEETAFEMKAFACILLNDLISVDPSIKTPEVQDMGLKITTYSHSKSVDSNWMIQSEKNSAADTRKDFKVTPEAKAKFARNFYTQAALLETVFSDNNIQLYTTQNIETYANEAIFSVEALQNLGDLAQEFQDGKEIMIGTAKRIYNKVGKDMPEIN